MKNSLKKSIIFSVKILIAIGLFYYFINSYPINIYSVELLLKSPYRIFFLLLICSLVIPISTCRWYLLFNSIKNKFSFKDIFFINYIGIFFNVVIPSSIGGDVYKSVYMYRKMKRNRSHAVFSVIVDKICGFMGLMIVCALGIIISWKVVKEIPLLMTLSLLIFLVLILCVAIIFFIFFTNNYFYKPIKNFVTDKEYKFGKLVIKIMDAVLHYKNNINLLLSCIGLSVLLHLSSVLFLIIIGPIFSHELIKFSDHMIALPLANLSNLIPMTPGGLGIGEIAYAQLIGLLINSQNLGNLALQFLALRISWVIISMPGMIVYILYKK